MVTTQDYIETVRYLKKLYDYCNEKLFNNELAECVITVQVDSKNKTYGWFTPSKVWKQTAKDEGAHEINMSAQQLNRSIREMAATMIHEMCHYYAEIYNLQDTSRSNTYHNKLFKKIAEEHGLKVERNQAGWAHTELTPETDVIITSFIEHNSETIIYRIPVFKGQAVKSSSTRKYECPCCKNSVRATKQVNIECADCHKLMREVD